MKYLPDTNTWVQFLRGDPNAVAAFQAVEVDDVALSSVVLEELMVGAVRSGSRTAIRAVKDLSELHITASFNHHCAIQSANLQAELISKGLRIGSRDAQIAGTALSLDAVLVTHDRAFKRIPGLKLEDWR